MAAYTSTTSGNWSAAIWSPAGTPGSGDTVTIGDGHTVAVNDTRLIGASTGLTVAGVRINSGGVLTITGAGHLTAKGVNNSTYPAVSILNGGTLNVTSGGTLAIDCTADYQTVINNDGVMNVDGGVLTIPEDSTHVFWTQQTLTNYGTALSGKVWADDNVPVQQGIASFYLDRWISNAAGTDFGTPTDHSLIITYLTANKDAAQNPVIRTPAQNGMASLKDLEVNGTVDDWFLDAERGRLFYRVPTGSVTSSWISCSFISLNWFGYGIQMPNNLNNNQLFISNNSTVRYMGGSFSTIGPGSSASRSLGIQLNFQGNWYGTNRNVEIVGNTFIYCRKLIGIGSTATGYIRGTEANPIRFNSNTVNCKGNISRTAQNYDGMVFNLQYGTLAEHEWIEMNNNTFIKTDACAFNGFNINAKAFRNIHCNNNSGEVSCLLYGSYPDSDWSGCQVIGNQVDSQNFSGIQAYNFVWGLGSKDPNNKVLQQWNVAKNFTRGITAWGNSEVSYNIVTNCNHHNFAVAVKTLDDVTHFEENIDFHHNVAYLPHNLENGAMHVTYAGKTWWNNVKFRNNTFLTRLPLVTNLGNSWNWFQGGGNSNDGINLMTNLQAYNNLVIAGRSSVEGYRVWPGPVGNKARNSFHVTKLDNFIYSNGPFDDGVITESTMQTGTFSLSGNEYNLSTSRNVTGIALVAANFSGTSKTGLSVTYSHVNRTLQLGSGTPVSIKLNGGGSGFSAVVSTATNNSSGGGVALDTTIVATTSSWSSSGAAANCPFPCWMVVTSGANAGQIRAILNCTAANTVRVSPQITLAAGDTFDIYASEIQLTDQSGNKVNCGILYSELPTMDAADTGISWAKNSLVDVPVSMYQTNYDAIVDDPNYFNFDRYGVYTPQFALTGGYGGTYIGATAPATDIPVVMTFTAAANLPPSLIATVSVTAATNVTIAGYLLTETAVQPAASDPGWIATAPTSYTFATPGQKSLWAWVKSDAGVVSQPVTPVSVLISTDKLIPVITWPNPSAITYGTALSGAQLNASANVAGTYVYSPAAGTTLNAGSHSLSVAFTPDNGTAYATATASVSLTVIKATATVTLSNLTQEYTGSSLTPTATTSPAGLTVTWTGTPKTAVGSYPVIATVQDANYQGTASGTFVISPQTIPAPTLTGATSSPSPAIAGELATVTLTGTNLEGATDVTATNGTVGTWTKSATQIIVPFTGTAAGTATFTVTTPGGTATRSITVEAAPVIPPTTDPPVVTAVTPAILYYNVSTNTGISANVTITGTALQNAQVIALSNGSVGAATRNTDTQIIVPVTGNAVGSGTLTVTTANGTSIGYAMEVKAYVPPPTLAITIGVNGPKNSMVRLDWLSATMQDVGDVAYFIEVQKTGLLQSYYYAQDVTPPDGAAFYTAVVESTGEVLKLGEVASFPIQLAQAVDTAVSESVLHSALTEGYGGVSEAPSLEKAIWMMLRFLTDKSVDLNTRIATVHKLDGTPAMTFELDNASAPKTITRKS